MNFNFIEILLILVSLIFLNLFVYSNFGNKCGEFMCTQDNCMITTSDSYPVNPIAGFSYTSSVGIRNDYENETGKDLDIALSGLFIKSIQLFILSFALRINL